MFYFLKSRIFQNDYLSDLLFKNKNPPKYSQISQECFGVYAVIFNFYVSADNNVNQAYMYFFIIPANAYFVGKLYPTTFHLSPTINNA